METRRRFGVELTGEPFGLRVSAVLMICMGCLFALYFALLLVAMVAPYLRHRPVAWDQTWRLMLLDGGMGLLAIGCWRGASALRMGRQWAAYLAMALGALCLWFCLLCVQDRKHPERQVGDSGEAIVVVPLVLPLGIWLFVYPNLPYVRREMRRLRPPD